MSPKFRAVGIGCDEYVGLSARAIEMLLSARCITGSPHQPHLFANVNLDAELSPRPGNFWKD